MLYHVVPLFPPLSMHVTDDDHGVFSEFRPGNENLEATTTTATTTDI